MVLNILTNKANGSIDVFIGKTNFGCFESLPGEGYAYYPRLQHKLTGDQYIVIGKELNKINGINND